MIRALIKHKRINDESSLFAERQRRDTGTLRALIKYKGVSKPSSLFVKRQRRDTGTLRALIYMALILLLAVLAGCEPTTVTEVEEQSIRPARLFLISSEPQTTTHEFVARVAAAQTVDMSFEVSGPLEKLLVREGQTITKGSLIASVDKTDYELAVREASVQRKLALQDLDRKKKLLRDRGISRSQVDEALAIYELRQVNFEQAREALSDTDMFAPFDGYVAKRFTDNHVNVRAGDKIIRLNDLSELFVYASIPEKLLATVSADSIVSTVARFAFAPGESFPLEYRENTGEAESIAQTYKVTFAMKPSETLNILPGMSASVFVELSTPNEAGQDIIIPITSLVSSPEKEFYVWLYDSETTGVVKRTVEIGQIKASGVQVLKGLNDGELIVATGASQLQTGMKIRVLGEPIVSL